MGIVARNAMSEENMIFCINAYSGILKHKANCYNKIAKLLKVKYMYKKTMLRISRLIILLLVFPLVLFAETIAVFFD